MKNTNNYDTDERESKYLSFHSIPDDQTNYRSLSKTRQLEQKLADDEEIKRFLHQHNR